MYSHIFFGIGGVIISINGGRHRILMDSPYVWRRLVESSCGQDTLEIKTWRFLQKDTGFPKAKLSQCEMFDDFRYPVPYSSTHLNTTHLNLGHQGRPSPTWLGWTRRGQGRSQVSRGVHWQVRGELGPWWGFISRNFVAWATGQEMQLTIRMLCYKDVANSVIGPKIFQQL